MNTSENLEKLIRWMQAPPDAKPPVDFDAAAYLERLQLADKWMRQYLTVRKVVPMLEVHFKLKGLPYSIDQARMDIADAQHLFGCLDAKTARYWAGLMLDVLCEKLVEKIKAEKWAEAARLSKEVQEWLNYTMDHLDKDDKTV